MSTTDFHQAMSVRLTGDGKASAIACEVTYGGYSQYASETLAHVTLYLRRQPDELAVASLTVRGSWAQLHTWARSLLSAIEEGERGAILAREERGELSVAATADLLDAIRGDAAVWAQEGV